MQLLSLYHDGLVSRASERQGIPPPRTAHARYTRFWTRKSALYRRIALALQMVTYTELLCEMGAKRRGAKTQWRVVVLLEAVKAVCRLLLLRITRARPLVTPVLPEREPIPEPKETDDDSSESELMDQTTPHCFDARPHEREWTMPRTGLSLPSLPEASDISGYLLGRVLTADDIKPANKLVNRLRGASQAAEVLHVLAPLVYAVVLARSKNKKSWTPWMVGLAVEYAARQMRETGLRTTTLERDEWNKRGWSMGWWAMRGAFYENVTRGVVGGVTRRMPSFLAGILEDYDYLWDNYYFSTSP